MADISGITSKIRRVRLNSADNQPESPPQRKISTKALIKKCNKMNQKRFHTKSCSNGSVGQGNTNNNNNAALTNNEEQTEEKTDVFDGECDNTMTSTKEENPEMMGVVNRLQVSQSIQKVKIKQRVISTKNSKRHKKLNKAQKHAQDKNIGDGTGLTWGRASEDADISITVALDENDPNYASSEEISDGEIMKKVIYYNSLSRADFELLFNEWLDEYLINGDLENFGDLLQELSPTRANMKCIPTFCISKCLDHKPVQRELLSKLLPFICVIQGLGHEFLSDSFDVVIDCHLTDLSIDYSDAPEVIGTFFARAVADDIIPPNYIFRHKFATPSLDNELAHRVFVKAKKLLDLPHSYAQLDAVWLSSTGLKLAPDGHQPVKKLIKAIKSLIIEYGKSLNMGYVERTLADLAIPHFLHELVYQTICIAFKNGKPFTREVLFEFLMKLFTNGYLTMDQIDIGINRVYEEIDEMVKYVPNATFFMEDMLERGVKDGWISPSIAKSKPKMRRRFISETVAERDD